MDSKQNRELDAPETGGFFARLKKRFNRGKGLGIAPLGWLRGKRLDDQLAEELEDQLLLADVGIDATRTIKDKKL